ncbi:hypothetical protein ACU8V4_09055 [Pseudoalteromonas mariniglutinosa]
MPNLEAALLDSDINAVGIALDYKNQHEVIQFVDELKLTMPILLGDKNTKKKL